MTSHSTERSAVTLTLPLPPNAANLRRHWSTAQRDKKAYWNELNMLQACRKIPKDPAAPFDPAILSAHVYLRNASDPDNIMARLKIVVDWLKGPWIVDDSPKHLTWAGIPAQSIDRKNPRLVLEIRAA